MTTVAGFWSCWSLLRRYKGQPDERITVVKSRKAKILTDRADVAYLKVRNFYDLRNQLVCLETSEQNQLKLLDEKENGTYVKPSMADPE